MKRIYCAIMILLCASLWSCGKGNDKGVVLDSTGKHPSGWAVAGNGGSHPAKYIAVPGSCYECHGKNLTGGISNVSCFSVSRSGIGCHPSGPGVVPHAVPYNNHNATARGDFGYCRGCHQIAANATKPPGCQNCHLLDPQVNPNNCVSCHTNPPNGAGYPNIAGSHARHNALNVAANTLCDQCHTGLGLGTVDHLNRSRLKASSAQPNQLVFGTLAKAQSTNATSCITSWCHGGNTTIIPQNNPPRTAPVWGVPFPTTSVLGTGGPAGTSGSGYCAQCHGYPPLSSSHTGKSAADCIDCHSHVNASGTGFTAPVLHINGTVEASSGHVFPYPGATHKNAIAGGSSAACNVCHSIYTPIGTYPVSAGTAPNCAGCHLGWPTEECSGCHGPASTTTPATGRPDGNTFPNRAGKHNIEKHSGKECTACHLFTSGDVRHGWSNRTKSTNARMLPALNWNPGTRTAGQGSCNPSAGGLSGCHGSESPWY